jgi:chemotaxis protein methyltransferase CheR
VANDAGGDMSGALANHAISDGELDRAAAVLGARCGLRFDARTRELLVDGLERAARAAAVSPAELVARLDAATPDALMQTVLRQVTIGETYFFRHPEHFDLLRERIVPELLRERARRTLRAWSAGCAAGEEAYSLAITLSQAAPACDVQVLGTDINKAALATGRRGDYGRWSQRGSARKRLAGYVTALPDGGVRIHQLVKARVRFEYLNLHDACYPSLLTGTQGLDVIFCRNVLVYFFAHAAEAVLARLAGCLVDGGWLIVSALDVTSPPPGLEMVTGVNTFVLRKRPRVRSPRPRHAATNSVAPPATNSVAPPATNSVAPPATDSVAPPATNSVAPPATNSVAPPATNSVAQASADDSGNTPTLRDAKRAADAGDLTLALALGRALTGSRHTPEALHLCALVLAEQGNKSEAHALMAEAVSLDPEYVLGHLSLGLDGDTQHLERVLELVAARRDDELLAGPDPLPVSWVRKVARAGLRNKGTL